MLDRIKLIDITQTLMECGVARNNLTFEKGVTKSNGKPYFRTWLGIKFFPIEPTAAMISYWDMCHALSIVRRYHGHTDVGVSVGNHTLFMLEAALDSVKILKLNSVKAEAHLNLLRAIFLHDCSEAYYNDLASPLKHAVAMAGYRRLENRCQEIIFEKFSVIEYNKEDLKKWDLASLAAEVRSFTSGDWHLQIKENNLIKKKLKIKTDRQVEKELLKWFKKLFPSHWLGVSEDAFARSLVRDAGCCE